VGHYTWTGSPTHNEDCSKLDCHTHAFTPPPSFLPTPLPTANHAPPPVPPARLDTPTDQVLHCPDMRHLLGPPRENPLLTNLAGVWEGRWGWRSQQRMVSRLCVLSQIACMLD
jgi:hypothetical protein